MELIVSTNLGRGGHDDLLLKIPALGLEVSADTYYFVMALEEQRVSFDDADVRRGVVNLLGYWRDKSEACGGDETIHLPFDFSDQYTGCLQVETNGPNVALSYGFSLIEGWRVDPLNPGTYFQVVRDFKARPGRKITVSKQDFLLALDRAIAGVEQEGSPSH